MERDSDVLLKRIEAAVPGLLRLAGNLTRGRISTNCRFILSEIRPDDANFFIQSRRAMKENAGKKPLSLHELAPRLNELADDLYDINLQIYSARPTHTIVDIRYFRKSALDESYRQQVRHCIPMLHCKIALPPWYSGQDGKFDLNWERKAWLTRWKLFRMRWCNNRSTSSCNDAAGALDCNTAL